MTTTQATDTTPEHRRDRDRGETRRIALVCDWCLPRFGGLELQLIDLARALRAAGHSAEIITATPGEPSIDGVPVHRLGGFRLPFFDLSCSPRQFRELGAVLRDGAFDVIHIHSAVVAPLAYGAAAIAARDTIPTAFTFHSMYDYLAPSLSLLAQVGAAERFPIAWSAVSRPVARETSRVLGGAPVQLLPNGIDPTEWRIAPATRDPRALRLISVMRLQVRKRPRDLFAIIDRAQQLVGPGVQITLDIVGDGRERWIVNRLAARAGPSRVRVLGLRSRAEIRDLFSRSDAFLLPTRLESFGIAALEALCAGLPIVARRDTGVEDFVTDGWNGLLGGSVDELAGAVAELGRNEPLRSSIAARNRDAHPPYAWANIVAATLAEYDRAEDVMGRSLSTG